MSQKPAEVIVRNRGTARRPSASHGRRSALVIVAVALASAAALAAWLSSPRLVGLAGAEPPRLEVDRQVIDFGDVPFERWVTATFTLRNTGRGPLRIADAPKVRALEGC